MSALHALLIGIDRYRPQRLPDGGCISDLHGCVRDVERMEEFLRGTVLAVPAERIRKLISPHSMPGSAPPGSADRPTYRNLVRELAALGERAARGDRVLVHYSGHGGRLPTVLPRVKGETGWDECLVPCDAAEPSEGGDFLRDIELHALVRELSEKGLQVILVLDSCHSGGALRGSEGGAAREAGVRSIGQVRFRRSAGPAHGGSWQALADRWPASHEATHRDLRFLSGWFPLPGGCVLLAACRPNELAREYGFDGAGTSGALTHFLLEASALAASPPALRDLHRRVLARIHSWCHDQTPVLEGDGNIGLGGPGRMLEDAGFAVLDVEAAPAGRVLVGAGWLHGIAAGARLALLSSAAPDPNPRPADRLQLEVENPGPVASWTRRVQPSDLQAVEPGDRAMLVDPGPWASRCKVAWASESLDRRPVGLSYGLDELLGRSSVLLQASEGEMADLLIGFDASGLARVLDASGDTIARQGSPLSLDEPEMLVRLVQRLEHFARYDRVRKLARLEASSPLRGQLRAELFQVPPGAFPGDPSFRRECDGPVLSGSHLHLVVQNHGELAVNLAVIDLQPDWGIVQVHPSREVADFELLDAGGESVASLCAHLPGGILSARDLLLVLVADGPLDFTSLELEPLVGEDSFEGSVGPSVNTRRFGDSCARLAQVTKTATRSMRPSNTSCGAWGVVAVEVGVVAAPSPPTFGTRKEPAPRTLAGGLA